MRINYSNSYYEGNVTAQKQRLGVGKYCWDSGAVYEGEFAFERRHGYGTQSEKSFKYVGEWRNGELEGYGEMDYLNGARYYGFLHHNLRFGFGVLFFSTGEIYVGEWKNDDYQGRGTIIYTDGSCRKGYWNEGKMNGRIQRFLPDGSWQFEFYEEGECIGKTELTTDAAVKLDPFGSYVYEEYDDGTKYFGNVCNEKYNGYGMLIYENQSKYVGEWQNDKYQGVGVFVKDNAFIKGVWQEDKLNGYGCHRDVNSKYFGLFKNNKYDGFGVKFWNNGDIYVGEFKENEMDGLGSLYEQADGSTGSGNWKAGTTDDFETIHYGGSSNFWNEYYVNRDEECYELTNQKKGIVFYHNKKDCALMVQPGAVKVLYIENGINDAYNYFIQQDGMSHYHLKNDKSYILYDDGGCYVGEVVNGEPEGTGKLRFADGDVWVGGFKGGAMHGSGLFLCKDGSLFFGTMKEGDFDNGKLVTINGKNLNVVNGKVVE